LYLQDHQMESWAPSYRQNHHSRGAHLIQATPSVCYLQKSKLLPPPTYQRVLVTQNALYVLLKTCACRATFTARCWSTTTLDILRGNLHTARIYLAFVHRQLLPLPSRPVYTTSRRCCSPGFVTRRTLDCSLPFQMAFSSDTSAHRRYASQWYMRHSHALAASNLLRQPQLCHCLQAGATLPTFHGKTSVWQKYLLATRAADKTQRLPR